MSIDALSAEVGVDVEGSRRSVHTGRPGLLGLPAFRQRNESLRIEESLGLRSGGSVVDERVLQYDVMLRGGLAQERFEESRPGLNADRHPDGTLLEYDLRLRALPVGKLSANAFASKLEDRVARPFLPSLDRRRERYGAEVTYNDAKLPMSLSFEHLFDDVASHHPLLEDSEELAEDTLRYEATWQPTETHSLRLNVEYQDRDDQYSGTRQTFHNRRNLLSLLDTIQFGGQDRHRLETLARYEEETGAWARDTREIAPRLTLQHTDSLSTTYGIQWLEESFQRLSVTSARADAGVTHQLADSLTSTLNLYGLRQDADENADAREWGGLTQFAFTRKNALGRFSSNLGYHHSETRTDDGRRAGAVVGERVTFVDPLPVLLAHADVDAGSLVVVDPQRFQVFLPGRDYLAVPLGRFTSLQRIPTGLIADRQTVSVSYTYRTYDQFALRRDRVDWRLQEDFDGGWTPYYAGSLQQEDLDHRRHLLWTDRNINRHRLGATWRRARWSAGGEYEYHDDSVDPYQALHVNGDVAVLQGGRQQAHARGTLSRFDFGGLGDLRGHDTIFLDLGMNYRYLLGRNLEAGTTASYRYEDDSLFGRTNGVDLRGAVSWRIGLFSVNFEIEYQTLHLPSSLDDSFAFWVKFRREIPVIGRSQS